MTRAIAIAVAAGAWSATLGAQSSDHPTLRQHQFTISAGVSWLGGYSVGANTATLRRNETGTTTPASFPLFRTNASIERVPAVEARIGYALTRALAVELGGSYGRPHLSLQVTDDAESSAFSADEAVAQYAIDASAVWQIPRIRLGPRMRPYLTSGGGYLRQLYSDRTAVETGKILHVGGGIRYWLRGGDTARRPVGVRAEIRVQTRSGGIELDDKLRTFPVVNFFGFFGF